jgi:hypothetical protein
MIERYRHRQISQSNSAVKLTGQPYSSLRSLNLCQMERKPHLGHYDGHARCRFTCQFADAPTCKPVRHRERSVIAF